MRKVWNDNGWYMYVCMCVCVLCVMLCVVTFLPLIIWRDTSFYDIVKEGVKENKK